MKKYLVAKVTDDGIIYDTESFHTMEAVNEYVISHKICFPFTKLAIYELKGAIT